MEPGEQKDEGGLGDPPRIHTNAMSAQGGPFDVTLDFGYRAAPTDDPEVGVRVTMSWEHALSVAKALQELVDGYAKQVGPIPDLTAKREEL